MWVVKFGGSLFNATNLKKWLSLLANNPSLVVVPGGGPFADQVREAQARFDFGDQTAHQMALLAMEQYGTMLCGLQPGFEPVASQKEIEAVRMKGITPVWMPTLMLAKELEVEQSWQVTSDSLAIWLAWKLGITRLVLVKSIGLKGRRMTTGKAENSDLVDDRFAQFLHRYGVDAWIVGKEEHTQFKQLIRTGSWPLPEQTYS